MSRTCRSPLRVCVTHSLNIPRTPYVSRLGAENGEQARKRRTENGNRRTENVPPCASGLVLPAEGGGQ